MTCSTSLASESPIADDDLRRAVRLTACARGLYEAERAYFAAVAPARAGLLRPWLELDLTDQHLLVERTREHIAQLRAQLPVPEDDPIERGLAYLRRQLVPALIVAQQIATRDPR